MVAEVHAASGAGPRRDAGAWKARGYVVDQRSVRGVPGRVNRPARHNLREPHTYSERLAITRDSLVEVAGHDNWNPWV